MLLKRVLPEPYYVPAIPGDIDVAMNDFHATVAAIETEHGKPFAQQWQAPVHDVELDTCAVCEIRYSCPKFGDAKRQRNESL